jgi:AcrR family transcriptional regulator
MGKGQSKGEQTRRAIVSRALSLVSEVGYEGLSIGVLAEEAKLSKSGLFAHFKSKEALQLGVVQESHNRLGHPVRERVVHAFRDWRELVARCAKTAMDEGHFRDDLDPEQFAYEFDGITMMYQQRQGLMRDRDAADHAQRAFESLLIRSRRSPRVR